MDQGKTPRDDSEFEALIQAVRETERALGGTTVYVAGVDLSHLGARFGDPVVDERVKSETEKWDREALEAARRGDADGWFAAIATHDDQTRICGLAPTYAMLRCAEPGEGRLLRYEQSDEPGGSFVSIAAMVWP
jgi:AmmeMemoRadiSam system protein B